MQPRPNSRETYSTPLASRSYPIHHASVEILCFYRPPWGIIPLPRKKNEQMDGAKMAVTYAIVQTGGKQYRAEPGGTLRVEKLEVELGNTVELSDVLLVRSESGMRVGTPYVPGAKVVAEVIRQAKGAKIIGFKYKPKKNERKRYGHRQQYTWLRVKEIIEGA